MVQTDKKSTFKELCAIYLMGFSLTDLRGYGRYLNLQRPTAYKKEQLVEEITAVLCGERTQTRTKRGAPIKNHYFPQEILYEIESLRQVYLEKNEANAREKEPPAQPALQLTITVETLTEEQKRLLKKFLKSL